MNGKVQAESFLNLAKAANVRLALAESCTGGMIAAALTSVAGCSSVIERGFVTYSNDSKTEMLGVAADQIERHGAVSEPVARAMAEGALSRSRADLALAVTGIAGPTGATPTKPLGLVHFAVARRSQPTLHESQVFPGDRTAVRASATDFAVGFLMRALTSDQAG
jgi:nicotinamide-nucleotide amidase